MMVQKNRNGRNRHFTGVGWGFYGGADNEFSLTVLFLCSPLFFKHISCFYDSLQSSPSCVLENSYTVFGSMLIQDFPLGIPRLSRNVVDLQTQA